MLMAIFDKSFIHSITADEAAVFDMHFMSNITPLFFVEVLADLEKGDKTPDECQQLVRTLAGKTPSYHSYPNVPHPDLVWSEFMGASLEIRGVPIVAGGRRVQSAKGLGTVIEPSPEMQTMSRLQDGQFGDDEYREARRWREQLAKAPEAFDMITGGSATRLSFRDLQAIKNRVDSTLHRDGSRLRVLRGLFEMFSIPPEYHRHIIDRWKRQGGPKLKEFLPYTMHVAEVDMFRTFGMVSGHIDPDRTSNYADMAYLYYLPFCNVFVSWDKLHRRVSPFFLKENQQFVWGPDLRSQLASLSEEYLATPDIKEVGLVKVAGRKVFDDKSFIGSLHTKSGLRRNPLPRTEPKLSREAEKALVEQLRAAADAPPPTADADLNEEDQHVTIKRSVRLKKGRFTLLPKDVKGDH